MMLQRLPITLVSASAVAVLLLTSPAAAQIVFDPNVFARQFEQLTELKKQVDTLTSQLKVAQDQLNQAKQLYDSFNKLTNANDIGALLNTPQFRKVLPQRFSDIEKLVAGQGSGNFANSINQYLNQNRAYAGNSGNSYYQSELDRIARQTGAKHSMGQAVYDTASQRIDALEELRTRISSATDVKEVLDLSARLQAEQALLQNDVLRMQGLAMIQQARTDMDGQREREKQRQLVDEMKAALHHSPVGRRRHRPYGLQRGRHQSSGENSRLVFRTSRRACGGSQGVPRQPRRTRKDAQLHQCQ
jgi:type IV secretion system protein VirB5